MRVELPSKVNGSANYAIDVQVPGMLYGAVLRAPVEGSVPDKIDDAKAKAIAGVVQVVRLPYGVGVLAETPWAAFAAREELDPLRHLDADRRRPGASTATRASSAFAADARNPQRPATDWSKAGDCARRDAEGRQHHGGRVPLRLRLSRADGAAERGRLGLARGRCGRDLGRHAEPDHGHRGAGQVPRHFARQGEAPRPADGRRLRPARQPRRRLHHRRGDAVEGGRAAGQGDVDARGRRPQRPLPADLGALPARRLRRRPASSSPGIIASRSTASTPFMDPVRYQTAGGKDFIADARRRPRAATTSRTSWSSSSTATPACAPIRCAASASPPTSSRPRRSSTRSRASAGSIRSPSGSSC